MSAEDATKPDPAGEAQGTARSFELALARLEEIVRQLESADLTLEETLARYEEGSRLVQECTGKLEDAEQRIRILGAGASHRPSAGKAEGEGADLEDDSGDDGLPF